MTLQVQAQVLSAEVSVQGGAKSRGQVLARVARWLSAEPGETREQGHGL